MTVAEYNVLTCTGETPADFDWDRYGELCEMESDEEYIQTPDWEDLI